MYHVLTFVLTTKELLLFAILAVLSFFWKGIALWTAARRGDSAWFIIMLIVNTAGILELIYVYKIARHKKAKSLKELVK